MEDEVAAALYKQLEGMDQEIRVEEAVLRRQESANRDLFRILVKSEPLDLKEFGSWAHSQPTSTLNNTAVSLPVTLRNAWIRCPLRIGANWTHVIREKVVVGIEVENIQSKAYVSNVSATILVMSDGNIEWQSCCRSCLLVLDSNCQLFPRESNILRPSEKALLVVSTATPSSLLKSELIVIGQASVRDGPIGVDHLLPPVMEHQRWRHWSGELVRTAKGGIDASGTSGTIVRCLVDVFKQQNESDIKMTQTILASLYVCQEQKRFQLLGSNNRPPSNEESSPLKLRNCRISHDEAKYCQLPLFDGILVLSSRASRDHVNIVISGWTAEQIDQFVNAWQQPLSPQIDHPTTKEDDRAVNASCELKDTFLKRITELCSKNQTNAAGIGNAINVSGDDYRTLRLDACAAEVVRLL